MVLGLEPPPMFPELSMFCVINTIVLPVLAASALTTVALLSAEASLISTAPIWTSPVTMVALEEAYL